MAMQAERGGRSAGKAGDSTKKKVDFKRLWPTIWSLVKPRIALIAVGFALVAVKTVAGLTLPYLSKFLLDSVLATTHPHPELLPKLIGIVFGATIIQAIKLIFAHATAIQRGAKAYL